MPFSCNCAKYCDVFAQSERGGTTVFNTCLPVEQKKLKEQNRTANPMESLQNYQKYRFSNMYFIST